MEEPNHPSPAATPSEASAPRVVIPSEGSEAAPSAALSEANASQVVIPSDANPPQVVIPSEANLPQVVIPSEANAVSEVEGSRAASAEGAAAESSSAEPPVFFDALFRQKRKHGQYRIVNAPALEGSVADTHAHLQLLDDPALAIGRCGIHKVHFVCTIVDVYEDGAKTFEQLDDWMHQGAVNVFRLGTGRC